MEIATTIGLVALGVIVWRQHKSILNKVRANEDATLSMLVDKYIPAVERELNRINFKIDCVHVDFYKHMLDYEHMVGGQPVKAKCTIDRDRKLAELEILIKERARLYGIPIETDRPEGL